jgi:hypothetical protein
VYKKYLFLDVLEKTDLKIPLDEDKKNVQILEHLEQMAENNADYKNEQELVHRLQNHLIVNVLDYFPQKE